MGHERIGTLPKTQKWQAIVATMVETPETVGLEKRLANDVLGAASKQFSALSSDPALQAAFTFLVDLSRSVEHSSTDGGFASMTLPQLHSELTRRLAKTDGSLEAREVVRRAVSDALIRWQIDHRDDQRSLFAETQRRSGTWDDLRSGRGFCEISRLFFANLTERYLRYYLEREASSAISNLLERDLFQQKLRAHVDSVSRIAFETAKITQSYSAGWYEKNARQSAPDTKRVRSFLRYAITKLKSDFAREAAN